MRDEKSKIFIFYRRICKIKAKDFLQQKLDKLDLGLIAEHGKIEKLHLPDRRILLSAPITGAYNEDDFAVLREFSFRMK